MVKVTLKDARHVWDYELISTVAFASIVVIMNAWVAASNNINIQLVVEVLSL